MKNNRTFLEKLLDGAEVEWKPLSLVSEMQRGKTITAKSTNEGKIPVISGGQKPAYYHSESNRDGKTITVAGSGAYAGYIMYWEEPIFVSDAFSIKTDESLLQIKYVYHFLLQNQQKIYAMKKGSGVPHVYPKDIGTLTIPIPPLPVQTEIVKILDALTALTSELTSELILRQKQYEYYREKLLSEEELEKVGFEWRTLEELVEKTQNIKWKNNTKTYRYIDLTSVDRENNSITGTIEINALNAPSRAQKIVKENDIIFATTRPTQQRIASITKEFSGEIASTGYCVLRANTDIVLPKWLFYFLSTINFKNYVEENQSGSAYPAISDSKVKEFRIPVPDVTIQQSIIEKLDKFYDLTNSLLHGLPKEINNRTKQYLYYQKELLNFKGEDL